VKVIEDELGEFGLGAALRRYRGEAAATGWRGDRYALWDVAGGSSVLLSLTAWDTPDAAADYARTYAGIMSAKHGLPPAPSGPVFSWNVGTRAFMIEGRGRTVLVVEGAPSTSIDALRAAAWARRVLH
jgi:hypothetical protein